MEKIKTGVTLIITLLCCAVMVVILSKALHKDSSAPSDFFQDVNYPEGWR